MSFMQFPDVGTLDVSFSIEDLGAILLKQFTHCPQLSPSSSNCSSPPVTQSTLGFSLRESFPPIPEFLPPQPMPVWTPMPTNMEASLRMPLAPSPMYQSLYPMQGYTPTSVSPMASFNIPSAPGAIMPLAFGSGYPSFHPMQDWTSLPVSHGASFNMVPNFGIGMHPYRPPESIIPWDLGPGNDLESFPFLSGDLDSEISESEADFWMEAADILAGNRRDRIGNRRDRIPRTRNQEPGRFSH